MRKSALAFGSFGLVVFVAALVGAAPPPGTKRPAFIASAKSPGRVLADGPTAIEVEIKNPGDKVLETNLLLDRMIATITTPKEGGRVGSVPVRVPAGGSTTVTIADSRGIDGCGTTFDRLTLEGGASTFVKLQPTCSFGTKVINPNAGLAPDRLASQQNGKVFYDGAFVPGKNAECGRYLIFEATAKNRSSARATNVFLKVGSPEGEESFAPNRSEIAPGADKTMRAGTKFNGRAGRWDLSIEATGAPVWQPGIKAEVSRLCSIVVELASSVAPLPAPPPQVIE